MTISGLVLTLWEDPESVVRLFENLRRDSRIHCGVAHGLRLPVVAETGTPEESVALFESLSAMPGVSFVDVVSVTFEELE